jgi:hypothetical protein
MPWNQVAKPTGTPWTGVAKPQDTNTIQAGMYMGPLGLTYPRQIIMTNWQKVSKPTGVPWTNVAKPID